MYKAYKYRIYPTDDQKVSLAKAFGCCRWYWNFALNLCQETYLKTGKGLSRGYIQSLLPGFKKEYPWLRDAYSQSLQVVALNLSTADKNCFEKRAQLPRFTSKHGRQSLSYPANVKFEGDSIKLPGKIGLVYCHRHRALEGTIKTVTVSKHADGQYYAAQNIRNEALRILSLGTSDTAWGGSVRQPGKTSVLLDAVPVESGSPILANGRVG
ncbi:helix-turn-helix domain-containing protein [Spirulina subsalsa FACHB-351]|uniref:Helix-turn-helix domain-containing protein n=1 Tax=Spirulina subsalsa FACHB-351 TaxID=234711 RepID=A0ABT3L160_9CYAN|nr:helix-turn-helix domain-containing protein [Spirulina subsalsa]MCW6035233.1 helix-turn-helix domain-containing protein [Spirulina subsalsa FACHB-351]